MRRDHPFIFQAARALGGLAFLVALTGCTAGSVSSLVLAAFLALGSAGLSACASSHSNVDGGARIDSGSADSGQDAGGIWESCCVDGMITTCFCPAGVACNYGWYTACGDGTCGFDGCDAGAPTEDAGTEDAGMSTWEPCCSGGMITLCECPAGFACNYGWFENCGGNTCVFPGETCPSDLDAGPLPPFDAGEDAGSIDAGSVDPGVDAGGHWEPCCIDERVTTCFCPAGAACNFGWFTPCSDGTCVATPGGSC
jgi:hypothetical protein